MARLAALLTLSTLVALSVAEIKFADDGDKTVLASYGDAMTSVSVLYKGPSADVVVSKSDLFTVGEITSTEASGGYTNYTIPMMIDNTVGKEDYTVTIGDMSITGSITAAGFVIMDSDGKVVSGDNGAGVSVGQSGTTTYTVKTVGIDGSTVDISGTKFTFKAMSEPYMKEVDESKTSITSSTFTLAIADYRVGSGAFMIMMETEAIEYMGEVFETVLNVKQETTPEPACVAMGGEIAVKDGYVMVPMFNLLTPPKSSPVKKVTITIGSESADWDTSKSTLSLPDQVVAFKISANGEASITCDGDDAKVLGGTIEVTGSPPSTPAPELAIDLVGDLPSSDTRSALSVVITVVKSSPETLTKADGQAIIDEFCASLVDAQSCTLTGLTKGSAIMDLSARVNPADVSASSDNIISRFSEPECEFQTTLGYACDELTIDSKVQINAVSGIGAASGGLAVWAVVLIACVGAFALLLVIVVGLWAVYRRSAEQSESDYSSSGPLGVPDPSDLLYEQSIVRDIYGRGDFPDGGPSQAVAEQRAREADLREEFPRPPSSSGLSRGANTDDASSTYSV